jgi:hypothetical protein
MNVKMMEFLFAHRDGKSDVSREHSTEGVVVPIPIIYETEILGNKTIVLYWHGDKDNRQREFPLMVSPELIYDKMVADPKFAKIKFIGTLVQSKNIDFKTDFFKMSLDEEGVSVWGMLAGMNFIFGSVSVTDPKLGLIAPKLYLRKEKMSSGQVELDF